MTKTPQILFITPPFTQLNTPYPATAYLKGYLNTLNIPSEHADFGLEVILEIFSEKGLKEMFLTAEWNNNWSENAKRIYSLQDAYILTIDAVISFLQSNNEALAYNICNDGFLPQASRFDNITNLDFAFGSLGIVDKAKYIATLYIEDIGDFITECIDTHFGFSRYAERLARSAFYFDDLYNELQNKPSFIDKITIKLTQEIIRKLQPKAIGLSIPFPGNLFAGLRIAQCIKNNFPEIKVIMGGGYVNTELRSIKDKRFFELIDFLTFDDGERPLECILKYINGEISIHLLKRTFALNTQNEIEYFNDSLLPDVHQENNGTPDYTGLKLNRYISAIEVANPMHKLWSDGRWNKLTLAHGCYWGKCTFCDINLDYIGRYEFTTAKILVDKIENIIAQTQSTGFHFVDEAAPPALLKHLAIELIKRNVKITWWTNIRFEKSFTEELCLLLAASGCIAVSGGLEVASDRLLQLIEKGVTVAQVSKVADNFTNAGILVHAYLMYGFPTQTSQETIDALEYVRQMFAYNIIQSGYWHQFAMTAHSPVGKNPEKYKVKALVGTDMPFANNDLPHEDLEGCNHEMYSKGLSKSLFNFMNGIGIDFPLQEWFDFPIPKTTVPPYAIENYIHNNIKKVPQPNQLVIWLGALPIVDYIVKKQKGKTIRKKCLTFHTNTQSRQLVLDDAQITFLQSIFTKLIINKENSGTITFKEFKEQYESNCKEDILLLWHHPEWQKLKQNGLLLV